MSIEDMDLVLKTIIDKLNNFSLSENDTTGRPRSILKRKSTSQEQCAEKILRKEPIVGVRSARKRKSEYGGIHEKDDNILVSKNLVFAPQPFREECFILFRQSVPDASFIRVWKQEPPCKSNDFKVNNFSDMRYYHPSLMSGQTERNPPVEKIQAILTFCTELPSEIIYSMQLPQCAILGYSDKITFTSESGAVEFAEKEHRDVCIASLFIPEYRRYYVKPFVIPVNFSNQDLIEATSNACEMMVENPKILRAVFILQYNEPAIFTAHDFPLDSDVIVNGGLMSTASENGVDTDWAVGFSIFAETGITVKLYGIDVNCLNQEFYSQMMTDLQGSSRGFCIFLFSTFDKHDNSVKECKSWETGDTAAVDDIDIRIKQEKDGKFDRNLKFMVEHFKAIFPHIPVIGIESPQIMFNNGYYHSHRVNASFLVVAYSR